MKWNDVIKKTVLENFQTAELGTISIIVTLGMAIAVGLFIYVVYRMNSRSGLYNRGFNKSLATLPVITSVIILAMGNNLTISLGMVGALSIVRFRSAIKDPADLTYLFWSISAGITVGAALYELTILMCFAVAILVSFLDLIPALRTPCLLVVSAENPEQEQAILACVKEYTKTAKVRSRNVTARSVEWIVEMQVQDEGGIVAAVSKLDGVKSVHLMNHDGAIRV